MSETKTKTKSKKTLEIGAVENLILFGGGPLIVAFAEAARARGLRTTVFAVKRHLEEIVGAENRLTLALALEKAGIPFFQAQDINTAEALPPLVEGKTLGIGLGGAYTFNRETLARFGGRLFDFMVIKLPQYRGGAHFTWQILRGDRVGCWNIQIINEEMVPGVYDSGAVIETREYTLPEAARIPADYFKAAHEEAIFLFKTFLETVQAGKAFEARPLDEAARSYFPRLATLKQALIDWSWSAEEITRFIDAFDDPYPGASTFIEGEKVFLKKCSLAPEAFPSHPFLSGLIYRTDAGKIYVAARSGALLVESVTSRGGADRKAGLRPGQRFFTPAKDLEAAMTYRACYDTEGLVNDD